MEKINNTESAAMNLIANSGDGRSYAFQALEEARNGNLEECNLLSFQYLLIFCIKILVDIPPAQTNKIFIFFMNFPSFHFIFDRIE